MKDVKQSALESLQWAVKSFHQDLEALPEEAFDKHFGGKSRTVADFVHEVNVVDDHIRLTITGQELFEFPTGWITAPKGQRSKESVIAAFDSSASQFLEAVNGFSLDQMVEPIQTDQGEKTRAERCRFVAWHLGYHSGQVNFIQTLLGDDEWHWN